jgi:CTP:molybdopterin cytidylyltransferase MocA
LAWTDGDHPSDGSESLRAGIRYAQLHHVVWRGLRGDLATTPTLSMADLHELVSTGSTDRPSPPGSFFRKLVAADRGSPLRPDDDEYQKLRERAGDRYGQARSLLLRQSMTHGMGEVLRIERIITLDEMPSWLQAGHRHTAGDQCAAAALHDVLKTLAGHFGYLGR